MQIDELKEKIDRIHQDKISSENIYQLLLMFDRLYESASETERKELMQAFIESIDIYPEKPDNGIWIKNIHFAFPIPMNGKDIIDLSLEDQQTLETVVLMSRIKD